MNEPVRRTPAAHFFFQRVKLSPGIPFFSMELRPKAHAVVIEGVPAAQAFVECAAGIAFPHRGKITLGEKMPGKTPQLRARIGSLLPIEPTLPRGANVESYLRAVLSLRESLGVESEREPEKLLLTKSLLARPSGSLSASETRKVALSLALALKTPVALVLSDPLASLNEEEVGLVLPALNVAAENGAIVVSVTPTARAALLLAETVHRIDSRSSVTNEGARFLLRSERPREIAGLLAAEDCVLSTSISTEATSEVCIEVNDVVTGAEAITSAICRSGIHVHEMRRLAPKSIVAEIS